jgi:hypothetical protein
VVDKRLDILHNVLGFVPKTRTMERYTITHTTGFSPTYGV